MGALLVVKTLTLGSQSLRYHAIDATGSGGGWADAGGEGGRVSPGEPRGSNRPARCARAVRSAAFAPAIPMACPTALAPG